MDDKDMPNRASNMEKAEGDRWTSQSDTVERREEDRTQTGGDSEDIVNRSGAGMRTPRRYDEGDVADEKA